MLQDFLSSLGGRDMVAVVAAPCGLQDPLTRRIRGVYPPATPLQEICYPMLVTLGNCWMFFARGTIVQHVEAWGTQPEVELVPPGWVGAGGRGAGRVFAGNLGGGGLNILFSGPKFPPSQVQRKTKRGGKTQGGENIP